MKKIGVNELCPCGSGKKYKKCYLINSENCSIFIKEKGTKMVSEYQEILNEILDSLLRSIQELNQLFFKTDDDVEIISSRMQLIGVFTIIDVLGNYWYEYLGKTGKPSERFDDYINKFCFINKNKEFVDRKYLQNITTEDLRHLRDSIVHFYGLGRNSNITILSHPSKNNSKEDINLSVTTLKKLRKNMDFIQPFELKKIIAEGAIGMINIFKEDVDNIKSYEEVLIVTNNIKRIQKKLREEGASFISSEMAKKLNNKISLSNKFNNN